MNTEFTILHTAAMLHPPQGIVQQMDWEQQAANALGLPWLTHLYAPWQDDSMPSILVPWQAEHNKTKAFKPFQWIAHRRAYHDWLFSQSQKVDAMIIRYYPHDPWQCLFIRR